MCRGEGWGVVGCQTWNLASSQPLTSSSKFKFSPSALSSSLSLSLSLSLCLSLPPSPFYLPLSLRNLLPIGRSAAPMQTGWAAPDEKEISGRDPSPSAQPELHLELTPPSPVLLPTRQKIILQYFKIPRLSFIENSSILIFPTRCMYNIILIVLINNN